jgi:hypothetical protein
LHSPKHLRRLEENLRKAEAKRDGMEAMRDEMTKIGKEMLDLMLKIDGYSRELGVDKDARLNAKIKEGRYRGSRG